MENQKRKFRIKLLAFLSLLLILGVTQAVMIHPIQAKTTDPYRIQTKVANREVKSKDGVVVLTCSLMYPQIMPEKQEAGNESIKQVNREIEIEAMMRFQEKCTEATAYTNEFIGEILQGSLPSNWLPFSVDISYEITMNQNGFLSFTSTNFEWLGGAHPNTTLSGFIYDVNSGVPREPVDLLLLDEKGIKKAIAVEMKKIFDKNPDYYFKEEVEKLADLEFDYDAYLIPYGLVFFFQPYAVAPYVTGIVRVPFPAKEHAEVYRNPEIFEH